MPHGPHPQSARPRIMIRVCEQDELGLAEVVAEVERAGGIVTDLRQALGGQPGRCWLLQVEGLLATPLRHRLDERFAAGSAVEIFGA